MAAGEDIMAFIGFVGFVVILFSAVKIIVAGKPTAGGEEKGPYARHFLRADLGAFFDKSRLLARTFSRGRELFYQILPKRKKLLTNSSCCGNIIGR